MNRIVQRLLESRGYTIVRRPRVRPTFAALGGLAAGAGLAYVFDPQRGTRRRALARDKAVHALRVQRQLIEKGARDAVHRVQGLGPRITQRIPDHPPDEVLIARVRSALGRHTAHAGAISVDAHDGEVTLQGPVLREEVRGILRGVKHVRGVRAVHEKLEIHEEPGQISGLQGEGRAPRPVVMRTHWPPALRLATAGSGLAAAAYGLARGGATGALISAAGTLAAIRGIGDVPLVDILGIGPEPHAVMCQKTVHVHRPIEDVYGFWSNLQNLPRFMDHVLAVEPIENIPERTRWRLRGPAGTSWTWEAETVENAPNERISWRTVGHADVEHEGSVHFEAESPEETRVHARMFYQPPAGALGQAVAALLGNNPRRAMARDMIRMRDLLEQERTIEARERIGREEIPMH